MANKNSQKMNLNEFLTSQCIKQSAFAKKADICEVTILKVKRGYDFRISTAKKIVHASEGKISYEALAEYVNLFQQDDIKQVENAH